MNRNDLQIEIEDDSSQSRLLQETSSIFSTDYTEPSIRCVQNGDIKSTAYLVQLLLEKLSREKLPPPTLEPYKISRDLSDIYTMPYQVSAPKLPPRPDSLKKKSVRKSYNNMFKVLLVACIFLVFCLIGVIFLALKFYLDTNSCSINEMIIRYNETVMGDENLTSTQMPVTESFKSTVTKSTPEIHCCCDMCRNVAVNQDRSRGQLNRMASISTPLANFDSSRQSANDVCVFGSACARVGIQIPDDLKQCADLSDERGILLNDSLDTRQRQNRKGIIVHNNSSLDIKIDGTYMVQSRLAYNPNCSSICPSSQQHNFVHKVLVYRIRDRHNTQKDEKIELLRGEQKCCDDCSNHSGISYVRGIFQLLRSDDVYIKTTGQELIKYNHISSYLEVVLLKEGLEDP
ncbi:hypothetical protein Bpfe_010866 [Biomphalaria pfeifferi]|uniref:THD domain-containing protein n=1 Tax=Biomphalaria pfeifferi TaxID=112525 RepID=A0AAD8BS56_BIOPF|nr:hypothetical protein Bpfe_010866 [Biomphalaria pfeifferi]